MDLIRLEMDGPVAWITLNRPEKLNALNREMLARLEAIADELDRNRDVRVVLITGAGKAFCVGADIFEWSALDPLEMGRRWIRDGRRIFDRYENLPQPVIAVLNGYTFGGGLELALAADLRLAAEGVELAFPEVSLGIIPGWGGLQRLPAIIGVSRAKQMIFTGARIEASTAAAWGLVNEVAPAASLEERAQALAEQIAGNGPVAVQTTKLILNGRTEPGLAFETLAGSLAAYTEDAQEGVAAFRERRKPLFRGK